MNNLEHGPYPLQTSDGVDFYKYTMSQLAFEQEPAAVVRFELTHRGKGRLADYVSPTELQNRLNVIREATFSANELQFIGQLYNADEPLFTDEYITHLSHTTLPPVQVELNNTTGDISVTSNGPWATVTFWETIVMSELNELYFETYARAHTIDMQQLYDYGDARLSQKIARLQAEPGIHIADFGTRRHFSYRWQRHVVQRLAQELPQQFIGTSNVGLARDIGVQPIGTFAHEMPMVYAALADNAGNDIRASHGDMLDDWFNRYGKALSIALTDTFGSDFFFTDFGAERAATWKGLRHDSGDAITFGERVITFYEQHGIDPKTKTIVFSDGLDITAIETLYHRFKNKIQVVFGWGTTLTNDLGLPALNIVMKATAANNNGTIKLSDVATKHTGDSQTIERYQREFAPVRTVATNNAA